MTDSPTETITQMLNRHDAELKALRSSCSHPEEDILVHYDGSCVGAGSPYPAVHVVCSQCGSKKIMFRQTSEEAREPILKQLTRQAGIKDQRLGLHARYRWETERSQAAS